jgi:carboxyl-terminal processing protease
MVNRVADESPARAAGIDRGWTPLQWRDQAYAGSIDCRLNEVISASFLDARGQRRDISVKCGQPVVTPDRSARLLDGGLVQLRIGGFSVDTGKWFVGELQVHHDAAGLVIDLRGNKGGRRDVLRECLDPLFTKVTLIGESRHRNGRVEKLGVPGRGTSAYAGRIFVLIDDETASAAEVFAASMQTTGRGTVVGRRSMGAVLDSRTFNLPDGFRIDLPIFDYRTAGGLRLEGTGVNPDAPVAITVQALRDGRDPDLEQVLRLATASAPVR